MLCSSDCFNHFSLSNTISITQQHSHPFQGILNWTESTGIFIPGLRYTSAELSRVLRPVFSHLSTWVRQKDGEGARLEGLISQPRSSDSPVCVMEQGSGDSKPWNPETIRAGACCISLLVFYNAQPSAWCRLVLMLYLRYEWMSLCVVFFDTQTHRSARSKGHMTQLSLETLEGSK